MYSRASEKMRQETDSALEEAWALCSMKEGGGREVGETGMIGL